MSLKYNANDGIIEIIIRDETGAKIDHFKMNILDVTRQKRVSAIIFEKYGINLNPEFIKGDKDRMFDF